jgi:GT2 family glycosyltransferase
MLMDRQIAGLLLNYRDAVRSISCIHSLLGQGIQHVVVWDNSADGGASAVAVAAAFVHDARVDLHVSAVNLGFAAGVNHGLECCRQRHPGAWVLLINNDARLLPEALVKLVDALDANSNARIAYPDIDHAGRVLGRAYCHRLTGLLSWRPRRNYFPYASGCCMLVATDRIVRPLFDEDFFMYGEDWELGWRLAQLPGAMVYVHETLVEHDGSASSGLGSAFYESHMVAAHLILARKLARSRLEGCVLLAARACMLVVRGAIRSIRFRSLVPCKALWHGVRIASGRR